MILGVAAGSTKCNISRAQTNLKNNKIRTFFLFRISDADGAVRGDDTALQVLVLHQGDEPQQGGGKNRTPGPLKEGFIQKRRPRSSLLFGGQN